MVYVSRRSFLRSGLIVGGGVALAACSQPASPSPTSAPAAPPPTTATVAAPSSAASPPPSAAASAVVSPSAAAASSPVAATGPLTNVKGAWVAITANQMVWPVAKDAGYFDKYGVNFDLSYISGSPNGVAGIVSQSLDTVSVAGSAIVIAQAAKTDVVMVAGFLNVAVFRVMAMSDITTIGDLKGKSIAVTRVGNADYFAWETIIEHQGWTADDLHFTNADTPEGQIALLQQGQVQAIALSPPNDVNAEHAGAHLVLDTATLNEPEQNTGMGVTRDYLRSNRATVSNIIKASIEAMARWKSDPTFTKGVIAKYLQLTDQDVIDDGYTAYEPTWPQAPFPSVDGMAQVIQEVTTQNPAAASVTTDQCIDASIVQELVDSGFVRQIYGA